LGALRDRLRNLDVVIVDALARGEPIDAYGALLLLRLYQSSRRESLADAVGRALTAGLADYQHTPSVVARAAWLASFVEATTVTDDERIGAAIRDLTRSLRGAWESSRMDEAAAAIGACLDTVRLDEFRPLAADAIDQLERLIGAAYRPGFGVGPYADQVRTASALLIAYRLSGRLPYSMLAEELMRQIDADGVDDFLTSCEAARVFSRLGTLHEAADYRAAAVIAPGADYFQDADRLLARLADEAQRRGAAGAIYGVALHELESARSARREP